MVMRYSDKLVRTMAKIIGIDEAYANLANAIIILACEDYYKSYRRVMKGNASKKMINMAEDCEEFFQSEWFEELTELDGEMVMNLIRTQARTGRRRKHMKH